MNIFSVCISAENVGVIQEYPETVAAVHIGL